MKKNVVIVVLAVISLSSVTFGFYQKTLAEEAREEAIKNAKLADANALIAVQQAEMARRAQAEAEKHRALAMANEAMATERALRAEELAEQLSRLKKK